MVGHVPVQVLLLVARAQFTRLVEDAMARDAIFGVEAIVKAARSEVIGRFLQELTKKDRAALNALQTVLQEQQHTAASLAENAPLGLAAATLWEDEMRFYP